jgi:hypothetical protein
MRTLPLGEPLRRHLFMLALALMALIPGTEGASLPDRMTYQGYLVDANGAPLGAETPRNYDILFRIYDSQSAGRLQWSEQQTVTVDKGFLNVLLGEGSSIPGEVRPLLGDIFNGEGADQRYIGMTVKNIGPGLSDVDILPRLQLLPTPYAFAARTALTASSLTDNRAAQVVYLLDGRLGVQTANPSHTLTVQTRPDEDRSGIKLTDGQSELVLALRHRESAITAQNADIGLYTGTGSLTIQSNGAIRLSGESIDLSGEISVKNGILIGGGSLHEGVLVVDGDSHFNDNTLYLRGGIQHGHGLGFKAANNGPALWGAGGGSLSTGDDAANTVLSWSSSGRVGIGTTSPNATLEVNGSVVYPLNYASGNYSYLNRTQPTGLLGTVKNPYSILASGYIAAQEFNALSDARIKRIIGRADPIQDLKDIQKLRVTDYRAVDVAQSGDGLKKGFIAQEVEEVMPEAVTSRPGFIPDLYTPPASYAHHAAAKTLTLTLTNEHKLRVGDRVRFYDDTTSFERTVGATPSERTFVLADCEKAPVAIFVFGREVPDFRAVNYDRVFTTGISAIQELARQVQALKESHARIAALEEKAAEASLLHAEFAELKRVVAQLAKQNKLQTVNLSR